ncbi:MAG: hypothetical protein AB7K71_12540 [Polyangiaceae bacterium]
MRIGLTFVALALVACNPPQPRVDRPAPSVPAKQAVEGVASAIPPVVDPHNRRLESPTGAGYQVKRATLKELPSAAPNLFLGDDPVLAERYVFAYTNTRTARADLVDVKEGRVIGAYYPSRISKDVVVVTTGKGATEKTGLLVPPSATPLTPKLIFPQGNKSTKLRRFTLGVSRETNLVWVFAEDKRGGTYQGEWKAPYRESVRLEALPFWPERIEARSDAILVRPYVDLAHYEPPESTSHKICYGYLLRAGAVPACISAYEPLTADLAFGEGARFEEASSGKVSEFCEGYSPAWLLNPPRVVSVCEGKRLSLYTPEGRHEWDLDEDYEVTGPTKNEVVAIYPGRRLLGPWDQWLDLVHAVYWRSEPLMPVFPGAIEGYTQLVQPPDDPRQLWRLDFEAGRIELIHKDLDCPGMLAIDKLTHDRAWVSCLGKEAMDDVFIREKRMRGKLWSYIIDFKSRTMWNTRAYEGAFVGGVPVGIAPGSPSKLVSVELE